MKSLIDYIIYRLFWIYQKKDPAPLATTTSLVILAMGAFWVFISILALRIIFGVSVYDIIPDGSRTPLLIYMFSIYGLVYWRIKRKYTENYINTVLTPKFIKNRYNKKIKGWIIITACFSCFLVCIVLASMIDWFFRR
ncbi:hypothetical protein HQ47_08375 [Porphyromonas macacae]|uniref:Uncharacterized protein n=1 Tax=Porphyromonas macacae TaxID=28115 RepID=A0A0A2E765_9PORP|nr:hypothetical protein HQ47_08375 [Porphyromonas macacae]